MSFYSKGTPYLTLFPRTGRLQFRIRIPADLQPCLGKREFRKSLGRHHTANIKAQALKLAAAAHEVFTFTRSALEARSFASGSSDSLTISHRLGKERSTSSYGNQEKSQVTHDDSINNSGYTSGSGLATSDLQGRALASLTDEEIRAIAENALLTALKGDRLISFSAVRNQILFGGNTAHENLKPIAAERQRMMEEVHTTTTTEETAKVHGQYASQYHRELQKGFIAEDVAKATDTVFAHAGIQMNPETESFKALEAFPPTASIPYLMACREMLEAHISYHSTLKKHEEGHREARNTEIERLEARQEEQREKREKRRIKVVPETALIPTTATTTTASNNTAEERQQSRKKKKHQDGLKLSDALTQFFGERALGGNWDARTQAKEPSKFTLFRDIVDPDGTLLVSSCKNFG